MNFRRSKPGLKFQSGESRVWGSYQSPMHVEGILLKAGDSGCQILLFVFDSVGDHLLLLLLSVSPSVLLGIALSPRGCVSSIDQSLFGFNCLSIFYFYLVQLQAGCVQLAPDPVSWVGFVWKNGSKNARFILGFHLLLKVVLPKKKVVLTLL